MKTISLNGIWEYRLPNDTKWNEMQIPSNWEIGGLSDYRGTVIFRKSFNLIPKEGKKYRLKFNGIDYIAKVFLNSTLLGSHEGYFQPFEFAVSKYLRDGENELIVEVNSGPEYIKDWPENKKSIKGVFGHHDIRPGGWHPKHGQEHSTGGIWNNVEIVETENVYIKNVFAEPILYNNYKSAKVNITIEALEDNKLKIIKKSVRIKNPRLWWTWDQGEPYIYNIDIEYACVTAKATFGLREIKMDGNKNVFLNGRKIFIRGSNIIPEEYLSRYTTDRIERDLSLAKDANLNALRIHAHINRKEFYSACDRFGILVWQDFPLQWEYTRDKAFISNAKNQIKDMVRHLCNHPSIGIWCCHNEPLKSIHTLDPILLKTILGIDKSRPVIRNSDFREHPYPGWFVGHMEHFVSLPGKPLVSEFGAQGIPQISSLKKMFSPKDIWPPNWQKWAYHNFAYEQTFHIVGIQKGKSINEFIRNSQGYQSKLTKFALERYRSQKFTQVSGLFHFLFIDPWPCISYSVIDYFRTPKKAFFTLKESLQPLVLLYFPERAEFTIGDSLRGMFYLVNDFPNGFKNAQVKIKLGNTYFPSKTINIEPNSCVVANKFVYPLPLKENMKDGRYPLSMEIADSKGKLLSKNTYTVTLKKIPKGLLEYNAVFNWGDYIF